MLTCPNCGRESPEDFAFCPACASPLVPVTPVREVRKTVTVIFCDVTGSTALGERLDPESLRDVQTRYFDTMRTAIERHGGTVEKYIGDAVMAVFGIPTLHEDDALRAARAAIDMREGLKALNKELERDRGVTIEVRIGVNTGEVVAGDVAAGQALVTGDAVNVAARLEQHAAPGDVLLGDATRALVREAVEAEPVEPLEAKGKAEPVRAWRLLGVRDVTSAIPRRLDSPLVGRERQLTQLRQAFEAAEADRACQLFTILGPAGVGKSRLVEEFLAELDERALVLRGRCLPYGEGITYFPIVEAIKQAAGLSDFDLPEVVETKVCTVLEGDEHQQLVCRHVSQLMGAAESSAAEETFWALRRFFEAAARERPLVLVLDDIHWGEPTFLDLVEHVADWSRSSPILLLCMARPDLLELRPAWGGGKMNAVTVSVEPLSGLQAEVLIANLLGSDDLAAEVAQRIAATAEGNPLFVEETLAMLIDDGVVVRQGDRWVQAGDLSAVTVPPSIQSLLAARIDRLTSSERAVLEAASVVGKDFFAGAVGYLLGDGAGRGIPADLLSLVRKELVRPEPTTLPGHDAFRFRHLLIRDAAYEAIPKAQRADLHERFADWLEDLAGDAVLEQEEIVAYHLEQALAYRAVLGPSDERARSIASRASARLASAARRAADRGDHRAAANLLRRAVTAVPDDDPSRPELLYDLGNILMWINDPPAAHAAFEEVVALASASGDRSREWLGRIRRSSARMLTDPHGVATDEVRAELDAAIQEFERLDDVAALSSAWTLRAATEWMPSRYEEGERAARRGLEYAGRAGEDRLLFEAVTILVGAQWLGTTPPDAGLRELDALQDVLARRRHLEAFGLMMRGGYLGLLGDLGEARRLLGEGAAIAEDLGSMFMVDAHHEQLGELELRAGDAEAAERHYRIHHDDLRAAGDEGHRSTAAAGLARALCRLGRFDEAEGFATDALRVGADDDTASQSLGRSALAIVLASRGRFDEAERLGREAVAVYLDAGSQTPNFLGDVWMDLALVYRMAGRREEAAEAARAALAQYEGKGNRLSVDSTRDFLAEL